MRWWFLLCTFCASPALAQWVQFTPCGLEDPQSHEYAFGVPEGPSRNLGPYWVWAPSVVSVMGFKNIPQDGVRCSHIRTVGGEVLVIGSPSEVLERLVKK